MSAAHATPMRLGSRLASTAREFVVGLGPLVLTVALTLGAGVAAERWR